MLSPALVEGMPAYLIAAAVVTLVVFIGLPAIPGLLKELAFYRAQSWDWRRDSGVPIFQQTKFEARFSFLPIGVIKILYYLNRIFIMCIVAIPLGIGFWRELS